MLHGSGTARLQTSCYCLTCVADTQLNLLRSANLCTISCSNPAESQGHMSHYTNGLDECLGLLQCRLAIAVPNSSHKL